MFRAVWSERRAPECEPVPRWSSRRQNACDGHAPVSERILTRLKFFQVDTAGFLIAQNHSIFLRVSVAVKSLGEIAFDRVREHDQDNRTLTSQAPQAGGACGAKISKIADDEGQTAGLDVTIQFIQGLIEGVMPQGLLRIRRLCPFSQALENPEDSRVSLKWLELRTP